MAANQGGTTIILGATGGIGRALAGLMHEQGSPLHLVAQREGPLADLAGSMSASWTAADAADFDAMTKLMSEVDEVRGVAMCVGSMLIKPAHLTTFDDFEQTVRQNLTTAFSVVRAATARMRKTGGSIVLASTCAVRIGLENHEAISAAKAGVEGLTRSAAATYAGAGIRINAVAPGLTRTPMTSRITSSETAMRASVAMHPLGRIGEPVDVAGLMSWLLSDASSWITGQVIGVDGGLASTRARNGSAA